MGQNNGNARNGNFRPEDHVSVTHAAGKIGCHQMTVLRLIEQKKLRGTRISDRGWWKVSKASLDALLAQMAARESAAKRTAAGRRGKR